MNKPTQQIYSEYTDEDFLVWNTLFTNQMALLENNLAHEFLSAIKTIQFNKDEIPNFEKTNKILQELTGWELIVVPELCPVATFFKYLAERKFTATCWLRSMSQIDYLEEPDMFHDVFGHAPLLTNPSYTRFFENLGKLAVKHIDNDTFIKQLERLYWFTIEFGMMKENNQNKIYGAGIASSREETLHAIASTTEKKLFNLNEVMQHEFQTDIIQDTYYVIESFEQLECVLEKLEKEINVLQTN